MPFLKIKNGFAKFSPYILGKLSQCFSGCMVEDSGFHFYSVSYLGHKIKALLTSFHLYQNPP